MVRALGARTFSRNSHAVERHVERFPHAVHRIVAGSVDDGVRAVD
jgi:hypothetical protein